MADYLKERSGRFYHRVRIPADLDDAFGGRYELARSLRTADAREAKVAAADCRARAERLFFQVRCGMLSPKQIRQIVDEYFERNLTEAEESRLDRIGLLEDNEEGRSNADGLALHLEEMSEDLARGNYRNISRIADVMLEESGATVEKGSREYLRLCREALKGAISATRIELDRMIGKYREERIAAPARKEEEKGEKLSKLITAYSHEMVSGGRWRGRTRTEAEGCLKLLLALVGDRDIRTIPRKDLIGFRDALRLWPSNAFKKKSFRGKMPQEVLAMQQKATKPEKPLSVTTINKYLVFCGAMFSWAMANGHLEVNLAQQLGISKRNVKPKEERQAYDVADLKRLLHPPVYTTELPTERPERYWLPLIGLLSGMRLAEIAQLYVSDIQKEDGVPVFDVNNEGDKALKTVSGRRIVPVHPILIELGLLEYVEQMRKKNPKGQLWPNLKRTQAGYGQDVGKWLQRINRQYITKNPLRTFHSMRHGFETALQRAHVPLAVMQQLTGHSHGNIDQDRYSKGFTAAQLLEEMKKARFGVEDELRKLPRLK